LAAIVRRWIEEQTFAPASRKRNPASTSSIEHAAPAAFRADLDGRSHRPVNGRAAGGYLLFARPPSAGLASGRRRRLKRASSICWVHPVVRVWVRHTLDDGRSSNRRRGVQRAGLSSSLVTLCGRIFVDGLCPSIGRANCAPARNPELGRTPAT
jgi:hypothetical protein